MSKFSPFILLYITITLSLPAFGAGDENDLLTSDKVGALTFKPSKVDELDFDTDVRPLHKSSLQGFDCMDSGHDGYLTMEELGHRGECVEHAQERGLDSHTRTALILAPIDADRDRRVSRREFNVWNEMKTQQTHN